MNISHQKKVNTLKSTYVEGSVWELTKSDYKGRSCTVKSVNELYLLVVVEIELYNYEMKVIGRKTIQTQPTSLKSI